MNNRRTYCVFTMAGIAALLFLSAGPVSGQEKAGRASREAFQFPVPPPPFSEGIFPCSQCHKDIPPNPNRRTLTDEHTGIVLNHAQGQRWCLDCHDTTNRDKLRLVSGEKIDFSESYRLCGQCHGDKFRDWKVGVHGKRTGNWNAKKEYLLCAHCHNPHDPRYKPIQPMPAPVRPEAVR